MRALLSLAVLCGSLCAHAQWILQDSGTTASLRGIHSLGHDVAWASGTRGTVLRTLDGGKTWTKCATPPGAEKLDFRGVQALDADVALVVSIGTGELSRVYKTTDGCKTWSEVFRNPDAKGFFDGILLATEKQLFVVGDPVNGRLAMFTSRDTGEHWFIADDPGLEVTGEAGVFAASNSSLTHMGPYLLLAVGVTRAVVYTAGNHCDAKTGACAMRWEPHEVPIERASSSAGVFSVAGRFSTTPKGMAQLVVAVGGAYDKAADGTHSAAFSSDGGVTWTAAETMPHGFRGAVAADAAHGAWIAVGPNGTDVSRDDGRTWSKLAQGAAADEDHGWNALSLPFVVGEKGRIAILSDDALTAK